MAAGGTTAEPVSDEPIARRPQRGGEPPTASSERPSAEQPQRRSPRPPAAGAGEEEQGAASEAAEPLALFTPPPANEPRVSESPKPFIPYTALEWVWFLPGNRILAAAEADASPHTRLEAMAYLPVLSRDGTWVEVLYQERRGWIDTLWQPPHRRRGARRGLLRHRYEPVHGSDISRLGTAKKMLGIRRSQVKVGAYTLFTNVEDQELLAFLDSAAVAAEEAYFARYGRLPSGDPFRSAVLFAGEADYRRYAEETSTLPSDVHTGHAGRGILTFYAEGRSQVALARTLVHEITHLLNDRSLAWELPPWLEEGMASDLGSVWVESSPDVSSDPRLGAEQSLAIQGLGTRILLLEQLLKSGKLPSVAALLSLDRETFYRPDLMSYSYAHSAAFIRYLSDGEGGRLAAGFHTFLKRIAGGLKADLLKLLERDVEQLDQGLRQWLMVEAQAHRELLDRRAGKLVERHARQFANP